MRGKINIILIVIIILLVAAAAGYLLFQKTYQEGPEVVQSFGSQLFDALKSPTEGIPETNPFKRIRLNPFE